MTAEAIEKAQQEVRKETEATIQVQSHEKYAKTAEEREALKLAKKLWKNR